MRTTWTRALTATISLLIAGSPLCGADKKKDVRGTPDGKVLSDTARGTKSADTTFDGRKHVEPVKKSTGTRTAQQIAKEENDKERRRQKGLKIKEPPSPRVQKKDKSK